MTAHEAQRLAALHEYRLLGAAGTRRQELEQFADDGLGIPPAERIRADASADGGTTVSVTLPEA